MDDSDNANERMISTYFHQMRSASKRKRSFGVDKIAEALRGGLWGSIST